MTNLISELKNRLPQHLLDSYIEGCSEEEFAKLTRNQAVDCLPATYREIMLFMGKRGLDAILDAFASIDTLEPFLKQDIGMELEIDRVPYPPDMFVFERDNQAAGFKFFRTADCVDNPPVYSEAAGKYFTQTSISISSYVLRRVELYSIYFLNQEEWRVKLKEWSDDIIDLYRYDPDRDEMVRV